MKSSYIQATKTLHCSLLMRFVLWVCYTLSFSRHRIAPHLCCRIFVAPKNCKTCYLTIRFSEIFLAPTQLVDQTLNWLIDWLIDITLRYHSLARYILVRTTATLVWGGGIGNTHIIAIDTFHIFFTQTTLLFLNNLFLIVWMIYYCIQAKTVDKLLIPRTGQSWMKATQVPSVVSVSCHWPNILYQLAVAVRYW